MLSYVPLKMIWYHALALPTNLPTSVLPTLRINNSKLIIIVFHALKESLGEQ